jgi:hypothetical protein
MKVKVDSEGKYAFDYKLEGILFLPSERVVILERATGDQRVITSSDLEDKIGAKKYKMVSQKLMHTNLFSNDNFQIMGLADR